MWSSTVASRRRRRQRSRRAVVVAALGVALLSTGAYAYWQAAGSGSGGASSDTPTVPLILSMGTASGSLRPGGNVDIVLTAANPNPSRLAIRSLVVDPSRGTNGFSVDASHSGCATSDLGYTTQSNGGSGWAVPGAVGGVNGTATITLPGALTLAGTAANACQGATVTVYVVAA